MNCEGIDTRYLEIEDLLQSLHERSDELLKELPSTHHLTLPLRRIHRHTATDLKMFFSGRKSPA